MSHQSKIDSGTQNLKFFDILALTSQIQKLKIIFAKQSTYQDINTNINVGNKRFNNGGSSCRTTDLTSDDYEHLKEQGGHIKSATLPAQVPRYLNGSELFTIPMAMGWILFCAMKTLCSYIIIVEIFYQLLIQIFSFYHNIYLTIDNLIITTHLIILNLYFDFINQSWPLNSKGKPCQNLLNRYRKPFYRQKKISGSSSQQTINCLKRTMKQLF